MDVKQNKTKIKNKKYNKNEFVLIYLNQNNAGKRFNNKKSYLPQL